MDGHIDGRENSPSHPKRSIICGDKQLFSLLQIVFSSEICSNEMDNLLPEKAISKIITP